MLRSHPSGVFGLKYWLPVLLLGGTLMFISSSGFRWGRLLFIIPFTLGGPFCASLAIVEVQSGNLRYRRLSKWRQLYFDEVVSCGVLWGGGIGYVKLNRFVAPWGKLYFVLDANEKFFGRGKRPLLHFIESRVCR